MLDLETLELAFEWRDIEEYEGLYKVSECGDVMSIRNGKKKLLKPVKTEKGYLFVNLSKNGEVKKHKIHRIVATAFCEGADYFPEVNHIDEDKTNNHYENLEWCDSKYNNTYGTKLERISDTFKAKKIRCIELNMMFNSISEAAIYMDASISNISNCLTGRRKTAGGYHWEYVD